MSLTLRRLAVLATAILAVFTLAVAPAKAEEKLRFAVGPFQPTPRFPPRRSWWAT